MGGPGSGGYKNAPGDVETHSAWDVVPQEPDSTQKLSQVRCKYCTREMAQHTSRQRAHLLGCQTYLNAMKDQGIETTITRQAADPAAFFKSSKSLQALKGTKFSKGMKIHDIAIPIRIQALALAEASISSERIEEITGVDAKIQAALRKLARERGYDPAVSMQLREEYVEDPAADLKPYKPRAKKRKPEEDAETPIATVVPSRAPPGYLQADNLPPGNWNFMTPGPHGFSLT